MTDQSYKRLTCLACHNTRFGVKTRKMVPHTCGLQSESTSAFWRIARLEINLALFSAKSPLEKYGLETVSALVDGDRNITYDQLRKEILKLAPRKTRNAATESQKALHSLLDRLAKFQHDRK